MFHIILFAVFGYLSGSVLYANVFGTLFHKKELYRQSADQNPGTANAFKYGGFWCGTLTLLCDLFKGFLPVYAYLRLPFPLPEYGVSAVLATPVFGHLFPAFHPRRGGKGIATTFGCLLGLLPDPRPLLLFAGAFLLLTLGLRITPHYYRTMIAYPAAAVGMIFTGVPAAVWVSFLIITAAVCLRLTQSKESREPIGVKLLWMR